MLENIVYVALRRQNIAIYYYKTANNQEIDFLVQNQQRQFTLVQVCDTLANPVTRQRETSSLQNAMRELGLSEATLVTRAESELIKLEKGTIDVFPAWKFLLEKQYD